MDTFLTSPPNPDPEVQKSRASCLQRKGWGRGWGMNTVGPQRVEGCPKVCPTAHRRPLYPHSLQVASHLLRPALHQEAWPT